MKKKLKKQTSICECGAELDFVKTPFMQMEQRVCPKCNRLHYVDTPIDWYKINRKLDWNERTF